MNVNPSLTIFLLSAFLALRFGILFLSSSIGYNPTLVNTASALLAAIFALITIVVLTLKGNRNWRYSPVILVLTWWVYGASIVALLPQSSLFIGLFIVGGITYCGFIVLTFRERAARSTPV